MPQPVFPTFGKSFSFLPLSLSSPLKCASSRIRSRLLVSCFCMWPLMFDATIAILHFSGTHAKARRRISSLARTSRSSFRRPGEDPAEKTNHQPLSRLASALLTRPWRSAPTAAPMHSRPRRPLPRRHLNNRNNFEMLRDNFETIRFDLRIAIEIVFETCLARVAFRSSSSPVTVVSLLNAFLTFGCRVRREFCDQSSVRVLQNKKEEGLYAIRRGSERFQERQKRDSEENEIIVIRLVE